MKSRVRLLPIVIVAVSGLLVLKATALLTSSESIFAEKQSPKKIMTEDDLPRFARVLAKMRFTPPPPDPEYTGSVPSKKETSTNPAEAKKLAEATKPPEQVATGASAANSAANSAPATPPASPQPLPQSVSASERALLERLQERRGTIDSQTRELELRENLLKAAEKKVDHRIGELKEIEGRMDGGAKAQQAEADKLLKSIVTMYETMKPKEAARVFDRLNHQVLVPIAITMKPARMAEILAAMTPESAEKLTVALATRSMAAGSRNAESMRNGDVAGELPRIDPTR